MLIMLYLIMCEIYYLPLAAATKTILLYYLCAGIYCNSALNHILTVCLLNLSLYLSLSYLH